MFPDQVGSCGVLKVTFHEFSKTKAAARKQCFRAQVYESWRGPCHARSAAHLFERSSQSESDQPTPGERHIVLQVTRDSYVVVGQPGVEVAHFEPERDRYFEHVG